MSQWISHSEDETATIAQEVAGRLQFPCVLCLYGDLGAGKTAFSRALIHHLCGDDGITVPSPTYNFVQTYDHDTIWHFDLYRVDHADDIYDLGWEEAQGAKLCIIEWPERLNGLKPQKTVDIMIDLLPDGTRRFTLLS